MQRLSQGPHGDMVRDDHGEYVRFAEALDRIAKLESALKACSFVLSRYIESSEILQRQAREAQGEADKALALMERKS